MAHPQDAEAGDAFVSDMDSAAAAFGKLFDGDDERQDEEEEIDDEQNSEAGEGESDEDELELDDEEQEGDDDEPEKPSAIDVPASLNAEEKARFAQLPEEAQRFVTELETRRNGQVQQATTKASEAQRAAEARAAQADAQAKAVYAQQLKAFADQLAPQRPDPSLAQTDPATFIALNAQYDAARAQHDEFVQQVQAMAQEADTSMSQAEIGERNRQLMSFPEVQNPETREAFFQKAEAAAQRIGLDVGEVAQRASASELKALRDIADAFEMADKYKAAMSRQMKRVREGKKAKPAKPGAAQPKSSGHQQAFRDAKQKLASSGTVQDAAAAFAALG